MASRKRHGARRALHGWAVAMSALYLVAALALGGGRRVEVWTFLLVFAALFGLYFGAVVQVRRPASGASSTDSRSAVAAILGWSAVFRCLLLFAGLSPSTLATDLGADLSSREVGYQRFLLYDNDVWRYLWDGHVMASGGNPYRYSPFEVEALAEEGDAWAEELLASALWQDVLENISYAELRTIYPPLVQFLLGGLHRIVPGSVFLLKLVLVLFDLGTCVLLVALLCRLRRPPELALIYAWNPLAVKEIAGSGHIDALVLFLTVLTVLLLIGRRPGAAGISYAMAVAAKLSPLALLPLMLRRATVLASTLFGASIAILLLPFVGGLPDLAANLGHFGRSWVFNPGPWGLIEWLTLRLGATGRGVADGICLALLAALALWLTSRDDGSPEALVRSSALLLGGLVLLSSAVMPWYLLWALPFFAVSGGYAWPALTGASLLSYLVFLDGSEHAWWLWLEYGLFVGVLLWEWRREEGTAA